jgi:hypothetical protein
MATVCFINPDDLPSRIISISDGLLYSYRCVLNVNIEKN